MIQRHDTNPTVRHGSKSSIQRLPVIEAPQKVLGHGDIDKALLDRTKCMKAVGTSRTDKDTTQVPLFPGRHRSRHGKDISPIDQGKTSRIDKVDTGPDKAKT